MDVISKRKCGLGEPSEQCVGGKIESGSFFCNLNLGSSSSSFFSYFGFGFESTLTLRSAISFEDSGNESD